MNEEFGLPFIDDRVARKGAGQEHQPLADSDVAAHREEYGRLRAELEQAGGDSRLPERPGGRDALNDLLIRLRGVTAP